MTIEIPRLADLHVHLRQGPLCDKVLPHTTSVCAQAVVMPNTSPPLTRPEQLAAYATDLRRRSGACWLDFLFMLTPDASPADVAEFARMSPRPIGCKLYPAGLTTHSHLGISGAWLTLPPPTLLAAIDALQFHDLILSVHPEMPGSFVLDSEADFIPFLKIVRASFPRLRLRVEHVTSAAMVDWVLSQPIDRVRATLTPQHLAWDLGCLFEGGLRPWRYCKPIYKLPPDRLALWRGVLDEHFLLGSDTAPHEEPHKLRDCGCAGVWSAPVLAQALAHLFEEQGLLSYLVEFTSARAARLQGFSAPALPLVLHRQPWTVPFEIDGMQPFMAGQALNYSLEDGSCPLSTRS